MRTTTMMFPWENPDGAKISHFRLTETELVKFNWVFKTFPVAMWATPLRIALINSSRDLAKFSTEPQAPGAASINYRSEQNASEEQKLHKKCKICVETKNHPHRTAHCFNKWKKTGFEAGYLDQQWYLESWRDTSEKKGKKSDIVPHYALRRPM